MSNDKTPFRTNTSAQSTSGRAWPIAEQHRQRASRSRRQSGPDEPSLPFWEFVFPER